MILAARGSTGEREPAFISVHAARLASSCAVMREIFFAPGSFSGSAV